METIFKHNIGQAKAMFTSNLEVVELETVPNQAITTLLATKLKLGREPNQTIVPVTRIRLDWSIISNTILSYNKYRISCDMMTQLYDK